MLITQDVVILPNKGHQIEFMSIVCFDSFVHYLISDQSINVLVVRLGVCLSQYNSDKTMTPNDRVGEPEPWFR